MIAPQILVLSVFFSILWGVTLWEAVSEYQEAKHDRSHYPKAFIRALRQMVMAFVLLTTAAAYLLRTAAVLAGLGDSTAGQVAFFALLGTNLVGGIFCALSLRFD